MSKRRLVGSSATSASSSAGANASTGVAGHGGPPPNPLSSAGRWLSQSNQRLVGLLVLIGGIVYLFWIGFLTWYTCPPSGCLPVIEQARELDALAGIPVLVVGAGLLIASIDRRPRPSG